MILVLWLARACCRLCTATSRASDRLYRIHYRHEARTARRQADRRAIEQQQRVDAAIDDVIAETRPVKRVRSPIHRDR